MCERYTLITKRVNSELLAVFVSVVLILEGLLAFAVLINEFLFL